MKNLFLITTMLCLSSLFFSCQDNEHFSTDPSLRLEFSVDTLSFDTVFTTIGSSTRRLMVHNRQNKSLVISSIELVGAGITGFRLNVDGQAGSKFTDINLLREDSMFIFVEVTVDPLSSSSPLLIADSIRFVVNGNVQYVHLEAIGQDVFLWRGMTLSNDTTLTGLKPFLIYDSLSIKKDVKLTIEKNARFFFHKDASLLVHGIIHAKGTIEEPILFRGDRLDNLFANVPYDNIPGQWGGIYVDSASYNNHFENVRIRNGISGILFAPSSPQIQKATFINTTIHNTILDGLSATNCKIEASNSLFSNAGGSVVKLIGGNYNFLHCTLANYMSWRGMRKDVALIIGNVATNDAGVNKAVPLTRCDFTNSIIAGSGSSELRLQNTINGSAVALPFSHLFTSCLIKIKGEDDANFVNTLWNVDPNFKNINRDRDYVYNFELDAISPAINKADRDFSLLLPFDIRGISRLTDEGPDMGCYEWLAD